jgi:Eukaryotic aspartyl protease
MSKIVRIPINNIYADGDYTGRVCVGAEKKPMNVLLDTGSSAFALNSRKYSPHRAGGDKTTRLAQTQSYEDNSSWTGAVIQTTVSVGDDRSSITASGINAAIAYEHSHDMFGRTDGILGLAYARLDDAYRMEKDTWSHRYTARAVKNGKEHAITPYLMQLKKKGVVSDKFSFLTKRSLVHRGAGGSADDPLNQGWLIIGGGEESKDLYTGHGDQRRQQAGDSGA